MHCIATQAFKTCRVFFKDLGPALPDILGRALRENEGRLEGGKHLSLEEENACPRRRKRRITIVRTIKNCQDCRMKRNEDGNVLRIKYTRNAYTDGFCNVQGERAW